MTLIVVDPAHGRVKVTHTPGLVAARVQRVDERGARVALVATTALLLGGDEVEFDVRVGPGCRLDVVETAGTVAYDAQGARSRWSIVADVAEGGVLTWSGEPFVIADGADVHRGATVTLASGATATLREILVFGRVGELGGALRSTTRACAGGRELLVEELDLTVPHARRMPGSLGEFRVIDSVLKLGERAPDEPALPVGNRYELAGPGTVARALTMHTHRPILDEVWRGWVTPSSRGAG